MRKNAAVVEDEEALFTHGVEGVSVLGGAGGSLGLDLEGPVQENSVVPDHLTAHFCDSSSRRSLARSHCLALRSRGSFSHSRGFTPSVDCPSKLTWKACPCSL